MAVTTIPYRWSLEEYLVAFEAGAFQERAELIDGEVWAVSIGRWHGTTAVRVTRALPNDHFEITAASLPAGGSLPDPDCWVLRAGAEPVVQLSPRMARWAAPDVLLVVEVSDETLDLDLGRKAVLYGAAGYASYWSVTRQGVYVHSEPAASGYRQRRLYGRGEHVPVPYADGTTLAVDDLIGTPEAAA